MGHLKNRLKIENAQGPAASSLQVQMKGVLASQVRNIQALPLESASVLRLKLGVIETLESANEEAIRELIKDGTLSVGSEGKTILLDANYSASDEDLAYSLECFRIEKQAKMNRFLASLGALKLTASSLTLSQFLVHPNVLAEQVRSQIRFSRKPGTTSDGYYAAILAEPIGTQKFQLTIISINPQDRYLDFGFISAGSHFDTVSSTLIKSYSSTGSFSFCGYSVHKMQGKSPTTSSSDSKGHAPDRSYFIEVQKDPDSVRIWTADGAVDLRATLEPGIKYHFYLTIYHKDTACYLSKV